MTKLMMIVLEILMESNDLYKGLLYL